MVKHPAIAYKEDRDGCERGGDNRGAKSMHEFVDRMCILHIRKINPTKEPHNG